MLSDSRSGVCASSPGGRGRAAGARPAGWSLRRGTESWGVPAPTASPLPGEGPAPSRPAGRTPQLRLTDITGSPLLRRWFLFYPQSICENVRGLNKWDVLFIVSLHSASPPVPGSQLTRVYDSDCTAEGEGGREDGVRVACIRAGSAGVSWSLRVTGRASRRSPWSLGPIPLPPEGPSTPRSPDVAPDCSLTLGGTRILPSEKGHTLRSPRDPGPCGKCHSLPEP